MKVGSAKFEVRSKGEHFLPYFALRTSNFALPTFLAAFFAATAVTVRDIILAAYRLQRFELIDTDSPVLGQRIDIVAKAPPSASVDEMQRMLEPLRVEGFKLVVYRENREMEAQVIVRARPDRLGSKISLNLGRCAPSHGAGGCNRPRRTTHP